MKTARVDIDINAKSIHYFCAIKNSFWTTFQIFYHKGGPFWFRGVKTSLSPLIVVLQSKLKMFCHQGVKYYTKSASGTQKITKVHFCLYLVGSISHPLDWPCGCCPLAAWILWGGAAQFEVLCCCWTQGCCAAAGLDGFVQLLSLRALCSCWTHWSCAAADLEGIVPLLNLRVLCSCWILEAYQDFHTVRVVSDRQLREAITKKAD